LKVYDACQRSTSNKRKQKNWGENTADQGGGRGGTEKKTLGAPGGREGRRIEVLKRIQKSPGGGGERTNRL